MSLLNEISLPEASEVADTMNVDTYDTYPYDPTVDKLKTFRNYLGGWKGNEKKPTPHNVVHT